MSKWRRVVWILVFSTIFVVYNVAANVLNLEEEAGKLQLTCENAQLTAAFTTAGMPSCNAKPPDTCDPNGLLMVGVAKFFRNGIKDPTQIGVVFSPRETTLLHKLSLQILRSGKVVFKTKLDCQGCDRNYAGVKPSTIPGTVKGYILVLDEVAAREARKFFVSGNSVQLVAGCHNCAKKLLPTFYFTKVDNSERAL